MSRTAPEGLVEMGAPVGHPFFGNQYTNGGYVNGSFVYKSAVDKLVRSVAENTATVRMSMSRGSLPLFLKKKPMAETAPLSISALIATGSVMLIGGVAVFAYLRRATSANEQIVEGEEIAGFGLCESCGQVLAGTGPAEVDQDENGDFVVCDICSYKNPARYPEVER